MIIYIVDEMDDGYYDRPWEAIAYFKTMKSASEYVDKKELQVDDKDINYGVQPVHYQIREVILKD